MRTSTTFFSSSTALALLVLSAGSLADERTTLPRHPDPVQPQAQRAGEPTDPLFDRDFVATDDPAFVLAAVESARQGIIEAGGAEDGLENSELRVAAERIRRQNEVTARKLERLATTKGWRLPQTNPARTSAVDANGAGRVRSNANFITSQIAFHQNTLSHYRAQIAGKGDADLKRALRDAVPGYQQNLELLLTARP